MIFPELAIQWFWLHIKCDNCIKNFKTHPLEGYWIKGYQLDIDIPYHFNVR